jgi:acetylglutamate kinase
MIQNFKSFYRKIFKGQIFVIKAGGQIITDEKARKNLISNIQKLIEDDIRILLIYGGGQAIDAALKEHGIEPFKIEGRRITSEQDIHIIKRVMAGDLNKLLSETCAKLSLPAYSLANIPNGWVKLKRRPKTQIIKRFDAIIESVHAKHIKDCFKQAPLILCPCLGLLSDGSTVNINADNVAISIASGIKAAKLVLLTNVDGVKINGQVASVLTGSEIAHYIQNGEITGGMQVKLENCNQALLSGVKRVHILNGLRKDALKTEIYTPDGRGTMIVQQNEKIKYEKERKGVSNDE